MAVVCTEWADTNDLTAVQGEADCGRDYKIQVVAVDAFGNESNVVELTDNTPPFFEGPLVLTPGDGTIDVDFSPGASDPDLWHYQIDWNNGAGDSGQQVQTGTTFSITGLVNDTDYVVQVTAVDCNANQSDTLSDTVTPAPPPTTLAPGTVGWKIYGYADDPAWVHPADGAPVVRPIDGGTGWPKATSVAGTSDMTGAVGSNIFNLVGVNGHSYVKSPASGSTSLWTATFASTMPLSLVYVGSLPTDGGVGISTRGLSNGPFFYRADDGSGISIYNGAVATIPWTVDAADHVFVVYIAANFCSLYVDGVHIGDADAGATFSQGNEMRIWSYSGAERFSHGADCYAWGMYEGLITSDPGYAAWSASAVAAISPAPDAYDYAVVALMSDAGDAHWPTNETGGNLIHDISGNAHHIATDRQVAGGTSQFDGLKSASCALSYSQAFHVPSTSILWFNTTNATSTLALYMWRTPSAGDCGAFFINFAGDTGNVSLYCAGGLRGSWGGNALNDGQDHMLAFVHDEGYDYSFYLDGVPVVSHSGDAFGASASTTFYVGNNAGIQNYAGTIKRVSVLRSLLSDSDIAALWAAG